jgi:hypothetical protein
MHFRYRPAMRREKIAEPSLAFVLLLFFFSAALALVYQVV